MECRKCSECSLTSEHVKRIYQTRWEVDIDKTQAERREQKEMCMCNADERNRQNSRDEENTGNNLQPIM